MKRLFKMAVGTDDKDALRENFASRILFRRKFDFQVFIINLVYN